MEKSGREVMGAGKTNTGEAEKNNITQGSIFGQLLLFFFPITSSDIELGTCS